MQHLVVFGGAGFIGREICMEFVSAGWRVTVVDGLMEGTTCNGPLTQAIAGVGFVECVTDRQPELVAHLVSSADVIIDSMGWTKHLEAMDNPTWDLRLNVASHLPVIGALSRLGSAQPRVIYLGSTHQYGKGTGEIISEDSRSQPLDVQGIHKLAAEHHWRIAASEVGQGIVSLRFGNTFGPGMSVDNGDVGLIGGFFRAALRSEKIEVFGNGRRRNILYSKDLARVVLQLAKQEMAGGFHPFNVVGYDVAVYELAQFVARAVGKGTVVQVPLPKSIQRIEIGEALLNNEKLVSVVGEFVPTRLEVALYETATALLARGASASQL